MPQLLRQFASNWKGMSNDQPVPKKFIIILSIDQSKLSVSLKAKQEFNLLLDWADFGIKK